MSFKDIDIKRSYINKGLNNVADCLIKPALAQSILYRRSVGFFSSDVFSIIKDSIPSFIRNKGSIQLVVSPELSDDDINAISLGYKVKKDLIEGIALESFENEFEKIDEDSLKLLYELIARNYMDIKIAIVKGDIGIYHDKLGILTDCDGNNIVFYGSANSSVGGYRNNYEKVRTISSLNDPEGVADEISEFESIWENTNDFLDVYSFNDSVQKNILKVLEHKKSVKKNSEPIELYDYQKEAIEAWKNNGYKGFYVMATGTGKTWTAIYSSKELRKNADVSLVIAAPYKHLIKQWAVDVEKVYPDAQIILVSSENPNWYADGKRLLISKKYEKIDVIFITTLSSFYSDNFKSLMSFDKGEKLLIVDEAHRFKRRDAEIKDTFNYLLGLSATPLNGKNNEDGKDLIEFFGGTVFNLPIDIALEKGFLVPYYYHPLYVNTTDSEEEKFIDLTKKMIGCYSKTGVLTDKDKLIKLNRARLRVISMASQKMDNIQYLISKVADKDHFVIYCGDGKLFDKSSDEVKHIQFVKDILDEMNLKPSQFTATEDIKRRMELVEMFNNNEIDSLVAIRCLDEGINIPSIKSALILSSNDDYREFVQRRGRILRKYKEKKYAHIYDVIVKPSNNCVKIAEIELRRFKEYASLAINKEECLVELKKMLSYYSLDESKIDFDLEIDSEDDIDE